MTSAWRSVQETNGTACSRKPNITQDLNLLDMGDRSCQAKSSLGKASELVESMHKKRSVKEWWLVSLKESRGSG